MATLTVNQLWNANNTPTNATSATLGIYDNTTSVQVVANGTAMTHIGTGQYQYIYASAVEGHTYTSTVIITFDSIPTSLQYVDFIPPSTTVPTSNDDGSTAYIAKIYAQQRGQWTNVKFAALGAISAALAIGEGPSYSITGRAGSESLSFNEFLANMRDTAAKATEMEIELTQQSQNVQPFDLIQHVGIRGRW